MDFSQALICLLNFATPAQSQDALECQSKRVTIDQSETSGKEIDLDSLEKTFSSVGGSIVPPRVSSRLD